MPAPLGILLRLLGASIVMPDPQDYTPPVVNIAYNPIPIGTYYRQVHKSDSLSTLLECHNRSCVFIDLVLGLPQLGRCSQALARRCSGVRPLI